MKVPVSVTKAIFNNNDTEKEWNKLNKVGPTQVLPYKRDGTNEQDERVEHRRSMLYTDFIDTLSSCPFTKESSEMIYTQNKRKRDENMLQETRAIFNL